LELAVSIIRIELPLNIYFYVFSSLNVCKCEMSGLYLNASGTKGRKQAR
jgi:hypothetical protein